MSWAQINQSTRSLIYAITVISLVGIGLWFGAQTNKTEANIKPAPDAAVPAATFAANAGTLGVIPDGPGTPTLCGSNGTPKNVTFTVSGLSGSVSSVELNNLTFGPQVHTFAGDLTGVLIAPNGASHTLFGRVLAVTSSGCGDGSFLTGPYTFADSASSPPSGGWWQAATAAIGTAPIASGNYRTTNSGGAGATNPMPATNMNPSFTGVADANGTWTLRFTDSGGGDTGSVSAATLTVNTAAPAGDANVDMNGDGKSDFVVTRGTSTPFTEGLSGDLRAVNRGFYSVRERKQFERENGGSTENLIAPPIYWYTAINGSATTGVGQLGDAETDFITPEDFDGDGKDDLAVWTTGAPNVANFKILQSSTNTVRVELFGQTGDDPQIVGDYDGDGKADPATYRCPALGAGNGQCYFFFRGSLNNPTGNITYVPWGFGEDFDFFVNPGDFDGDGKYDFCIQRSHPTSPTNGQFVLLKSSNLGVEYINWGNSTDIILPGDYDGDGRSDFCVSRTVGGSRTYHILERDGGGTGGIQPIVFGSSTLGDVRVPGDYDGDAKQDIAIWRPNADPAQNYFWVLQSSNGAVTTFEWGQCPTAPTCDVPAANWYVH